MLSAINTELAIHALGQVHCTYYYSIFHRPGALDPTYVRGVKAARPKIKIKIKNKKFVYFYFYFYFLLGHL
jgi:hypothetical protein